MNARALGLKIKRLFDVAVAGSILVLLAPVVGGIALWIRIAMGSPVLFSQSRVGRGGRTFVLHKFRTMADLRGEDGNLLPDEARITRLGRIMRRLSLDELPSLLNVLRGEMSLVGPRPLLPEYRDLYTAEQWRRHEVVPGITGAAQARGRNSLSWREKFELDVWYVDNWSLWLDAKLLALTTWKVLKREGISASGHATMPRFGGTNSDSGGR